ncbi:MAG: IMP dehydrogenase, partial [Caldilineae bacterium]
PKRSPVRSRSQVDTSTRLTRAIRLHIPILSANMDTVTEASMAIAMARAGGLGVIHRFMTVEKQARQVAQVKRAEGFIVEKPYAISQDASIQEAARLMQLHDVGGLVVTNGTDHLIGLVTQRDILLAPDTARTVGEVMTKPDQIVSVGPNVSMEEAQALLFQHRLEKLPILDADGRLVGLITAKDITKARRHPNAVKDPKGRLRVGAAIGVGEHELRRAEALLEAGADVIVLDIAHGHADHCIEMLQALRSRFPQAQIIAGNVATGAGAVDLVEAGADAVKVGIGPGSICTTRVVTGFGVPQLTAIMDCAAALRAAGLDAPIIADGGIRTSGDLVKALAAGADTVMIGSLFAGCEEAPGAPVIRNGQKVKVVRGMASLGATIGRQTATQEMDESAEEQEDWGKVVPEGVEAIVPYRGYVAEILHQLVGGLRSGMSYGGAETLRELQENAEFIEITPAGVRESFPHDVQRL